MLTEMGASFGIATGGVQTPFIAAPLNCSSAWVRAVDEISGAVFEQEATADLPATTRSSWRRAFTSAPARRPPPSLMTARASISKRAIEGTIMTERTTLLQEVGQAFRENGQF